MASCNMVAVYPVIGWWRERHNLKKYNSQTRYSLIVSLETPPMDIDIYSCVKNIIEQQVAILVQTGKE